MISQFDSRCPACGEKIYEGDEIAKDEDLGWVHDECYEPPIRIDRSKLKAAKKTGPSLAERLEPNDRSPVPPQNELERYRSMDAHTAVRAIIGCIDGLTEEYQTKAADWDAAADVLVNWAVAHGAKR